MTCSCGEVSSHVVARRVTADGFPVLLWSDGAVTGRAGAYPPGLGPVRGPRAAVVGRAVLREVELYNWDEIPALVRVAREALT